MASLLGLCENFTYTKVPPRKSTPNGMPCQKSMDSTPATLNNNEKARKYHFLPRKSMFGLRKNSTSLEPLLECCRVSRVQGFKVRRKSPRPFSCLKLTKPLKLETLKTLPNTQRFAALLAAKHEVKDHARHEHRREQVGQQTEGQGYGKTLHRARAEDEKDERRHNRGHVCIHDRDPGMRESLIHRRGRSLSIPQFFPNALEDQDIRIHAHTNRQDHPGDSRQGQRGPAKAQEAKQNNQVQNQRGCRADTGTVVVDEHENQHREHADDRGLNA